MRPTDDIFPPAPTQLNFSLPIPIVSVRAPISPSPHAPSSAAPPSTLPLPLRPLPHPDAVVLGCLTGEVRRMRSVLDMRLGAMAGAPVLPETDQNPLHISAAPHNNPSNVESNKRTLDVFGLPIVAKEDNSCPPLDPPFGTFADGCSVVLAESPSRLDLSALLC